MNLFQKAAAAIVLTLAASPAYAQDNPAWKEVGAWSIYKNAGNCRALTIFNSVVLSIAHYKGENRTTMMILDDKSFAAAKQGASFDGTLVFVKGEELVTDFSNLAAQGVQLESGTKGVYFSADGDKLLTTFGQSNIVGMLKGDEVVVSLKIEVPSAMVSELRKCSATA